MISVVIVKHLFVIGSHVYGKNYYLYINWCVYLKRSFVPYGVLQQRRKLAIRPSAIADSRPLAVAARPSAASLVKL